MAKYTVTRSCGHEEVVNLIGPGKSRKWRLENVEPQKLCAECWKKRLEEEREEEYQKAVQEAQESGLPELTGTEKQVAWAETIRQNVIAKMEAEIYDVRSGGKVDHRAVEALESIKATRTEARWWIDNRRLANVGWSYEIQKLLDKEYKEITAAKSAPPAEVIADAKAEATVRPEKPVTETVAEIRALENSVEIHFPEKREDFRELVKDDLKMKWDGKWVRKLYPKNGTPADRAAEAGHRLLAAGFVIRIFDEAIRQRAINGDYEPECTKWVQARGEGKYKGWFAINWDRKDDYYKAARAIGGSRWDRPSVVVPPEKFEEVLDFAEKYGFKVSAAAQKIVEAARQAKESALVAKVEPLEKRQRVVADSKPPVLEVPAEVGVADEFKD